MTARLDGGNGVVLFQEPNERFPRTNGSQMQVARHWDGSIESEDSAERVDTPSDHDLIRLARQDIAAFAPLYERYAGPIHLYCYRRLGNREDAADATSIVFTRALGALPRFTPDPSKPGSTVRAWLFTIARNVVLDRVRRTRPQVSLDAEAWSLRDGAISPEDHAILKERSATIGQLLVTLPERQRAVVELRLADLTLAEICMALALSESAVKSLQFRAFKTLRDQLRERTS